MTEGKNQHTILVVGGDGKIGNALSAKLSKKGYTVTRTSRRLDKSRQSWPLDLAQPIDCYDLPKNISVAFICAGVSSIEQCRLYPEQTYQLNVEQTEILCKQLVGSGSRLVYLSSNVVFDGSSAYRKVDDSLCPVTEYGRQKAEIETRLLALGNKITVVRLTKVITKRLPLIADWIECLMKSKIIEPRADMSLAPLSLEFVVNILSLLINTTYGGILHLSGAEEITYMTLAQELARQLGVSKELIRQEEAIEEIAIGQRPPRMHTTLDTSSLTELFRLEAPSYQSVIKMMLAEEN